MGNVSICIYSLTQRNITDNIYDELEALLESGGQSSEKGGLRTCPRGVWGVHSGVGSKQETNKLIGSGDKHNGIRGESIRRLLFQKV